MEQRLAMGLPAHCYPRIRGHVPREHLAHTRHLCACGVDHLRHTRGRAEERANGWTGQNEVK